MSIRKGSPASTKAERPLPPKREQAGGHSSTPSTLPCLSPVLPIAGSVPVLAAGGSGEGTTLSAVVAAGAEKPCLGPSSLQRQRRLNTRIRTGLAPCRKARIRGHAVALRRCPKGALTK